MARTKEDIQKEIDDTSPLLEMEDLSQSEKDMAREKISDLNAEMQLLEHNEESYEAKHITDEVVAVVHNPKLLALLEENKLPANISKQIYERFSGFNVIAEEWKRRVDEIIVADENDKVNMAAAKEAESYLKAQRIAVGKTRKEVKADYIKTGKAIDAIAGYLELLISPIEEAAHKKAKYAETLKLERENKLKEERTKLLEPFGVDLSFTQIEKMNDEQWEQYYSNCKIGFEQHQTTKNAAAKLESGTKRLNEINFKGYTTDKTVEQLGELEPIAYTEYLTELRKASEAEALRLKNLEATKQTRRKQLIELGLTFDGESYSSGGVVVLEKKLEDVDESWNEMIISITPDVQKNIESEQKEKNRKSELGQSRYKELLAIGFDEGSVVWLGELSDEDYGTLYAPKKKIWDELELAKKKDARALKLKELGAIRNSYRKQGEIDYRLGDVCFEEAIVHTCGDSEFEIILKDFASTSKKIKRSERLLALGLRKEGVIRGVANAGVVGDNWYYYKDSNIVEFSELEALTATDADFEILLTETKGAIHVWEEEVKKQLIELGQKRYAELLSFENKWLGDLSVLGGWTDENYQDVLSKTKLTFEAEQKKKKLELRKIKIIAMGLQPTPNKLVYRFHAVANLNTYIQAEVKDFELEDVEFEQLLIKIEDEIKADKERNERNIERKKRLQPFQSFYNEHSKALLNDFERDKVIALINLGDPYMESSYLAMDNEQFDAGIERLTKEKIAVEQKVEADKLAEIENSKGDGEKFDDLLKEIRDLQTKYVFKSKKYQGYYKKINSILGEAEDGWINHKERE